MSQISLTPAHAGRLLFGAGILFPLLSGCVSRQAHQEVLEISKYYQDALNDSNRYVTMLEATVERLEANPVEASVDADELSEILAEMPVDAAIDQRMRDLEQLAASMGSVPGDVVSIPVEGGYGFSLKDSVLFDSGSAEIKPEGREILLQLANDIVESPFDTVWVRGHTDADPVSRPETLRNFPEGNLELSAARALKVAALMTNEGSVPRGKLVVAGFGPARPLADNATVEGKRRNRRVEIFVLEDDPEVDAARDGSAPPASRTDG